ncbi:DUF2065 domain-containing protein [Aliiglaciecola litoralis]|uniref:DUF2065 domain-containing protein n=1 Tax=Aliiglaciecola litoralis TaxID=582857 RepID=A0ABP3WP02_9ALTE
MTDTLLLAAALVLIIEGIGPMLFTKRWRNYVLSVASLPPQQLRSVGGVMVVIGVVSLVFVLS